MIRKPKYTAELVTDCLNEIHDILKMLEQIVRKEAETHSTASIYIALEQIAAAKRYSFSAREWVLEHQTTQTQEAGK